MTLRIFKTTLKANARSLVFWAAVAAMVLFLANSTMSFQNFGFGRNFHKALANFSYVPLRYAVPTFIGLVVCVDLLRDRKNAFYDIQKGTTMKTRQYFVGKLCAYLLLGFIMAVISAYAHMLIYLMRNVFPYEGWQDSRYTIWEVIWLTFERAFFYGLNSIPIYTALAFCVSMLTHSSIAGIVSTLAVSTSSFIIIYPQTYIGNYVYPVTDKIFDYFYFQHTHAPEEAITHIELQDVFISYAYGFAIAAVLMILGYLRLRRLNDR